MNHHNNNDHAEASAPRPSKRTTLQALLFTAGSIGTTLLALGLLGEVKIPRSQGE